MDKKTLEYVQQQLKQLRQSALTGREHEENNLDERKRSEKKMINKKTWEEFRNSGLLWWINMVLHTFGWAICCEIEKDGSISDVYPARAKFRGFDEKTNTEGYIKVSSYLVQESKKLLEEADEK